MPLPTALAPLRHRLFRTLWAANVTVSLGVWMQSTTAGWMMTSLSPDALMVSLVQAATVLPVFLLILPSGALADIIDRKRMLLCTQVWMLSAASILTLMTAAHATTAWSLLALTFAIGAGIAMNGPAWGTVIAESVPRADLVQAVALNGVGFNIARAVGPALAGFALIFMGPVVTFGSNAIAYLAVIAALLSWRRADITSAAPPERLVGAIKSGVRFVRHTYSVQAAMARAALYFMPCSALWAMLPLVVRQQLQLDSGAFGLLLGLMGVGGVTAGLVLPNLRARLRRGQIVFYASLLSSAGMLVMSASGHWLPAAFAMVIFGLGWVTAASVAQASAQIASPPWVRSRALSIYQLSFNLALMIGTFFWGWLGTQVGLSTTLLAAGCTGVVLAVGARFFDIDRVEGIAGTPVPTIVPQAEAVAPVLAPVLSLQRGRVMESQHYQISADQKEMFLAAMADLREARGRSGAVQWQLGEDVSNPEHWVELWWLETWTDHLREGERMSEADRAILTRALSYHVGEALPPTRRFITVTPHRAHVAAK